MPAQRKEKQNFDSNETCGNTQVFEKQPSRHFFQRKLDEEDLPGPDYFHPSERIDETDEPSVIEAKDGKHVKKGYKGLKAGEVLDHGQKTEGSNNKYCTKRCVCIVGWQVFVMFVLAVIGVATQIVLVRAGIFDPKPSGGPVVEEQAPAEVETVVTEPVVVEEKYTWVVSGDLGAEVFSPTLKNVLSFGDESAAWTSQFPSSEYEMQLSSKDISPTKFSIKTAGEAQRMSGAQLSYTDGNVGPLFESESSADASLQDIDFTRWSEIRKIGMAVDSDSGILGVRFYDSKNRKMLEQTWQGSSVSTRDLARMWKTQQLSSKQRIIGYRAATAGDFITRFGWAVWEP